MSGRQAAARSRWVVGQSAVAGLVWVSRCERTHDEEEMDQELYREWSKVDEG